MESLKIYEINANYIDYLLPFAPHLFHNSKKGQANSRKYIGVLLQVHGFDYFAPLSSFKPKHEKMKVSKIRNQPYRSLLLSEYRFIKSISHKICKHAETLYAHRLSKGDTTPLGKRCNDFVLLEEKCKQYR